MGLGLGLGLGLAMAMWQDSGGQLSGAGLAADDVGPLQRRLSELETSLALERSERQSLARELARLKGSVADVPARTSGDREDSAGDLRELRANASANEVANYRFSDEFLESLAGGARQHPELIEQSARQQRFDRFVAAGIAPVQAQAIMQREEEIDMQVLRARHAATLAGAAPHEVAEINPMALLRTELGDTEYAKYLEARGRRTSVSVHRVLSSSPAEIAGLQPGDEIVAYNGRRVFSMSELDALSWQVAAGAMVPLQVIRDGQSIEFSVAAGPIGIGAP